MSNPEDITPLMDLDTAYGELCRFADAAGIDLPSLEEIEQQQDRAKLDESQDEPEDFLKLRKAIAAGRLRIDEGGALSYPLAKPCVRASALEISPASWPYAKALRAFHANSRGKKGRSDMMGGLLAFVEALSGLPTQSLTEMTAKRDCDVVLAIANLLLGE